MSDMFGVLHFPGCVVNARLDELDSDMPSRRQPRQRLTLSVKIDAEIVLRARQLARDFSGRPAYLRLNSMIAVSLTRFMDEFERSLADGEVGQPPAATPPTRNSIHR